MLRQLTLLLSIILSFSACGQLSVDGELQSTHWSPDSSLYVEVYKENQNFALPGQGSDHLAIIVLCKRDGAVLQVVDSGSPNKILLRDFHSIHWEMGQNRLSYALGRYLEWIDEDGLDEEELHAKISTYLETENWQFFKTPEVFGDHYYVLGEFFGDSDYDYTLDVAVLIQDSLDHVRLIVYEAYNYKYPNEGIQVINLQEDYGFTGYFRAHPAGEAIWSNWNESSQEIRSFAETPNNEVLYLNYDALYLHAGESCGGGFIYWQDEKWHWKQQE